MIVANATVAIARWITRRGRRGRSLFPAVGTASILWLFALAVTAVVLLPIVYLIVRALEAGVTAWALLVQARTWQILGRTLWLALAVTMASALVAIPLAWLTTRTDLPLRQAWVVLLSLPLAIPSYVGAYLVVAALGPRGILQEWLEKLWGITRLPEIYGFPGTLLVLTLLSYPYIFLSVRAMLLQLDPALEEASRSLGRGPWATFRRVILPQLRPALASGGLLVALYTLRDFGAVSIMRYTTFTRAIYIQYQSAFNRSDAALLSLVLVAITLVLLALELQTRGRVQYYRTGAGVARRPPQVRLGRWRWPALLFCSAVVGIALILPAGVLLYWLARGLQAGEQLLPLWRATRNSILVSGIAAVVAVVAALPGVILSARRPSWLSRLLEQLTYIGFALPGIAIALALVFFGIQYARPLYQTLPMLILAYVVLFLPEAVGSVRASLLQVQPSLEEAARSLGRRPLQVFTSITLPLVRPGIAAGAGLVFLTAMKELPATLILGPAGFKTLATSVWSAVSEAFFARAAAPALLLVLASSLPMAFLTLREQERHP
ncbi:MAG: iron ABC transporter permease [Anaerolineae bacterium]|nr:iron ABC transporter permease [Anaerolineae bacterium]MDW8098420.1 iron ABC transporter permease [Anaerolineae bacterium]